jgi:hypothetical protein
MDNKTIEILSESIREVNNKINKLKGQIDNQDGVKIINEKNARIVELLTELFGLINNPHSFIPN